MAFKAEEEDDDIHWHSSAASKRGNHFNLFDEDVGFGEMRQMILSGKSLDVSGIEEDDMINFDGTPAVTTTTKGVSKPSTDYQSVRYHVSEPDKSSYSSSSMSRSSVSSQSLDKMSAPISIQDAVQSSSQSKERRPPTLTEMSKLESEINFLKRSLAEARRPDQPKLSVRETVKRMLKGQMYSLEQYRSKEDKLLLLDETIASHDGNAIIAAVLFIRSTLKSTIFNLELVRRPIAVEHYISFLRQNGEFDNLMDLLGMLGRTEEAAMMKYKQAVSSRHAETKLKNIQMCHRSHFLPEKSLAFEASLVDEHIQLLQRQLPIEASDAAEIAKGSAMFRQMPRAGPILDHPVITTLFYCCLYYYNLNEPRAAYRPNRWRQYNLPPDICPIRSPWARRCLHQQNTNEARRKDVEKNNLASPIAIKKAHKLTEKQYQWTVIRSRVGKMKKFQDLEALFAVKAWLGGSKVKPAMDFSRIVPILKKFEAPREFTNKYCNMIEGYDARLEVGLKCGCHESVIDVLMPDALPDASSSLTSSLQDGSSLTSYYRTLLIPTFVSLKDRQQLLEYYAKLPKNSQEWFYATDVLKTSTIKWKN